MNRYECRYSVNGKMRVTWFDNLREVKEAVALACDYDWLLISNKGGTDDIVQCEWSKDYHTGYPAYHAWIRDDMQARLRKASRVQGKMLTAQYAIAMDLVKLVAI